MKRLWHWVKDHSYSYALLYLVFYIMMFFALESVLKPKYMVHCSLDDLIPFCEWFAPFYFIWFLAFPFALLFFLFYSKEDYQNLCFVLMNGATLCFLCYILWPTELNLRIDITRGNLFCKMMNLIWALDTPTNVCPSLHVSISTSIALVAFKSEKLKSRPWARRGTIVLMLLICASTVFVKQHSVIDVFFGMLVTALFGWIAYHTEWRAFLLKTPFRFIL